MLRHVNAGIVSDVSIEVAVAQGAGEMIGEFLREGHVHAGIDGLSCIEVLGALTGITPGDEILGELAVYADVSGQGIVEDMVGAELNGVAFFRIEVRVRYSMIIIIVNLHEARCVEEFLVACIVVRVVADLVADGKARCGAGAVVRIVFDAYARGDVPAVIDVPLVLYVEAKVCRMLALHAGNFRIVRNGILVEVEAADDGLAFHGVGELIGNTACLEAEVCSTRAACIIVVILEMITVLVHGEAVGQAVIDARIVLECDAVTVLLAKVFCRIIGSIVRTGVVGIVFFIG